MKNYSRYVATYLLNLLSKKEDFTITKEQYILLLDTVFSNNKNFPTDLKQELSKKLSTLQGVLFKNKKEKYQTFFDQLFKKILTNNNTLYQDCICDILIQIFEKDETILTNWNKIYSKNVAASAIILKYLGKFFNF